MKLDFALRPAALDRLFRAAERAIALLDRVRPIDASREQQSLLDDWRRGRRRPPRVRYASAPDLSALVAGLDQITEALDPSEPWARLYAGRAAELALEARLAQEIGRPRFAALARQRYGHTSDEANDLALRWAAIAPSSPVELHFSDDERDPLSLVRQMRAEVGRQRLPFRVVVAESLDSRAAVADGVIVIRANQRLGVAQAQRIVAHEIFGHALPRARAATDPVGILSAGTRGASDDEEGRALVIERRLGLCDPDRQRELGLRHSAALAVHSGADWVETARRLLDLGSDLAAALEITARAQRGGAPDGGLGRELVYLPALLRVEAALSQRPALESWFERGRVSLDAASWLAGAPNLSDVAAPSVKKTPTSGAAAHTL